MLFAKTFFNAYIVEIWVLQGGNVLKKDTFVKKKTRNMAKTKAKNETAKSLLLIFVKHPIAGQVKTRLAADTDLDTALAVYQELLEYTENLSSTLVVEKRVYYGNFVPENDFWSVCGYERRMQKGADLGERMKQAIAEGLADGFRKVVLIGSDCAELTHEILAQAFTILSQKSVVLGPATDGGYYLIGTNGHFPFLFENKTWSTSSVLSETLVDLKNHSVSYDLLPVCSDIDRWEDIIKCKNVTFRAKFVN